MTIGAFLRRAALVAPDKVALVDEPGATGSLGDVTYAQMAEFAAAMASKFDELSLPHGARVAVLSPNSAKFLIAFYGISGWGRVIVPINYRLNADDVAYIVEHSGASLVLYDPEQAELVTALRVPTVALDGVSDAEFFDRGDRPEPLSWHGTEDDTCSINYTSGTTARPKGVQLTHRNCWMNTTTFSWHIAVSDRDVLLHTLPMFHVNGWGTPYGVTAMTGRHVVQRKIDGEDILRRVEAHGVTLLCCAPAVINAVLDAASVRLARGDAVPGRSSVRIVVAGAPPPATHHRADRGRTRLGVHSDLRTHRNIASAHRQPRPGRVGRSRQRRTSQSTLPRRRTGRRR
jgi:acyl-CoA synthetase (AMP-forming)/AMP-acid ligase II